MMFKSKYDIQSQISNLKNIWFITSNYKCIFRFTLWVKKNITKNIFNQLSNQKKKRKHLHSKNCLQWKKLIPYYAFILCCWYRLLPDFHMPYTAIISVYDSEIWYGGERRRCSGPGCVSRLLRWGLWGYTANFVIWYSTPINRIFFFGRLLRNQRVNFNKDLGKIIVGIWRLITMRKKEMWGGEGNGFLFSLEHSNMSSYHLIFNFFLCLLMP